MGKTAIQWTEQTWNPIVGCDRVSAGCDHCYAATLHNKRYLAWKRGTWPTAPAQYHKPFWSGPGHVQLMRSRLTDPLHWRKPRRVFVNSVSDLFHEDVPDDYIADVFRMMMMAPDHIYQILTKRPARMRDFLRERAGPMSPLSYHLPHIWLGTSVEDQRAADERIPFLLDTPAAVRFLSCEPLLGPVNLDAWLAGGGVFWDAPIQWVIVGGESGSRARPMDVAWARDLLAVCHDTTAAPFVKQLGAVWAREHGARDHHGGAMEEWPADLRVREYPRTGGQ